MTRPYSVPYDIVQRDFEPFIDDIFGSLSSSFERIPIGDGFVSYQTFSEAYERLKVGTQLFADFSDDTVLRVSEAAPMVLIVLRAMLGFSPPELAHITKQQSGVDTDQGFARAMDQDVRKSPLAPMRMSELKKQRFQAMIKSACALLRSGCPAPVEGVVHRLQKTDTIEGLVSIRTCAELGISYAMLLYERFLGRSCATLRDAGSGLVGDVMESAIESLLTKYGISHRKTKRAERITGLDQAPDFIIPDIDSKKILIEAKITEDDGTARDKVARIQRLRALSDERPVDQRFEVIACLDGRGFGIRRQDMRRILEATRGKVFTLDTLPDMIPHTGLMQYVSKNQPVHGAEPARDVPL